MLARVSCSITRAHQAIIICVAKDRLRRRCSVDGLRDTPEENDERGQPILKDGKVTLGNLDVRRDFGFAGDYVAAMHAILQSDTADDYVIGTGQSNSIRGFCEIAFRHVGRNWATT